MDKHILQILSRVLGTIAPPAKGRAGRMTRKLKNPLIILEHPLRRSESEASSPKNLGEKNNALFYKIYPAGRDPSPTAQDDKKIVTA